MRVFVLALCSITFSTSLLTAQRGVLPTDTLAEIGTAVISARDLLERLELMPFPGKDQPAQHDSAKIRALRALVAEKLLAQDAAVRGMNRDSASVRRRLGLERLMVRDELFKREVTAKVSVSDRELSAGMRRYPIELRLLFLSAGSASLARELRDSLAACASLDTAITYLSKRLLRRGDTLTLTFGSQDWTLEDTAYALSMKRRLSQAVKTDYLGWGVLYLLEQRPNDDAVNKSIPDRINAVRSVVRQRKMDDRAGKFQGSILSPQRAEVDSQLFDRVGTLLRSRITADAAARASKAGYRLALSDLDSLEVACAGRLREEFVHITGGGMTLQDMIDALRTQEIAFPVLDAEPFLRKLNASFKDLVREELVAREGYRQRVQHSEAVRHDVAVWEDYWAASSLIKSIRDSVTPRDGDVMAFLILHGAALGAAYEVNVREVLCDSLHLALDVLRRAVQGESLATMARQLSRRPGWKARDGESGFFAVDAYPQLGFPALFQDTGTIGGPVRVKEGYSVFSTLGKRTSRPGGALDLDSLKYFGYRGAWAIQQEQAVDSVVSALAERTGVNLYLDRLSRVKVTPSNMFTRRYIGFGGVVTAVPTILPLWNWKGEQENRIVP
jgi:hypothetical protein